MCDIKVRFSESPDRHGVFEYALRAEVVEATGISPKIFVYHQSPKGIEGNSFSEFDHIATPVDFQEIPEDAASETVPWYRTDKLVVWLRNASDLELSKQLLVDDIAALQRAYSTLSREEDFTRQETVDFAGEIIRPGAQADALTRRVARLEAEVKTKASKISVQNIEDDVQKMVTTDSPEFVGVPTAPTADPGTNTDQLATTAFVQDAIKDLDPDIPIASATKIGGIKVGQNLTISEDGVLSAQAGGGGEMFSVVDGVLNITYKPEE